MFSKLGKNMENSYIVKKKIPLFRGIKVKTLQITLIITFILSILLFSGPVSALDTTELSAYPLLSKDAPSTGEKVTIRISLQSNTSEQLKIDHIGINFDWMASGGYYGVDLTGNPITIESYGTYTSAPFVIQIPSNTRTGSHTYYIGVVGLEGADQTSFSWDSSPSTIQVLPANVITPTPSPTAGGGQTDSSSPNQILYIAIVAIAVAIVVSVIVLVMRKKRKQTTPVADQPLKPIEGQS
jgi:hypothetical protein